MRAGARVEVATYKREDGDFVLWKPSSEDVVGWDSPWGRGRPGWHIECSAMIESWFGDVKGLDTIDIHGGGLDLIFPHHENEIAQSRCAHDGAPLARYWVHNGFVDMGAEKMSKSLGNVVTVDRLLADGHRGSHLRYSLLSAHYRQPLNWTNDLIGSSQRTVDRWRGKWNRRHSSGQTVVPIPISPPHPEVVAALQDDLNTPLALSVMSRIIDEGDWPAFSASAELLGIDFTQTPAAREIENRQEIQARISERQDAKRDRDFATADRIRDQLKAEGILLEDGPDGTTWRRA